MERGLRAHFGKVLIICLIIGNFPPFTPNIHISCKANCEFLSACAAPQSTRSARQAYRHSPEMRTPVLQSCFCCCVVGRPSSSSSSAATCVSVNEAIGLLEDTSGEMWLLCVCLVLSLYVSVSIVCVLSPQVLYVSVCLCLRTRLPAVGSHLWCCVSSVACMRKQKLQASKPRKSFCESAPLALLQDLAKPLDSVRRETSAFSSSCKVQFCRVATSV